MFDEPMITNWAITTLIDDMEESLSRYGRRFCAKTGRRMELRETHLIVISCVEIHNVTLLDCHPDFRGLRDHPRFAGYFRELPVFEKNDPMPWAYISPEEMMNMDTLERM